MNLKYYLQPNRLTESEESYTARVLAAGKLEEDDVIDQMLRKGTSFTRPDAEGFFSLMQDTISDMVAQGFTVVLPLCTIRPGIKGVFSGKTDQFDKFRHTRKASLSGGSLINSKLALSRVEKVSKGAPSPDILEFQDVNSDTLNSVLTPGGIGVISGSQLKFDREVEADGIYLIANDNSETKIAVIAQLTETRLVFSIPALPVGEYMLEVRRSYTKNGTVRSDLLDDSLTVNA